jgi:hypothetical protein
MSNNNRNVPRQETNDIKIRELEKLYATYLKELCPDWTDARIRAEIKDVIREQDLDKSKQKRLAFKDHLLKKMDEIKKDPDEWLFGPNGS